MRGNMTRALESILEMTVEGKMDEVIGAVEKTLEIGISAKQILKEALIPGMEEVGRLFEAGEFYVPEMLISARAMQAGLEMLKPQLVESNVQPSGTVVAGTVQGDMHDIGKNLVCMMLEGAGFIIQDLGTNVSPDIFIEAIRQGDVDIVAMSALLTTTMPGIGTTIEAFRDAGVRDQVRIMIGGAPVTAEFANQVGADGYAPDASQAAKLAKSLVA